MEWNGIYPAVVTPFYADGRFHDAVFEQHIQRLYEAGIDGLYVLGQTGEGAQQPLSQRKQVLEAAIRLSPHGKRIIVHVGATTTRDAVQLAQHAEDAGAHAISSLPPLGTYNYAEIRLYYETLTGSTNLPTLLYHHPDTCPEITPERVLDLCSIPNVFGFKFTDYNLYLLTLIRERGKVVFNGRDEQLAASLLLGANGGIGTFYNIFPRLFVEIFESAHKGDWAEAARLQILINPVLKQIFDAELLPATRAILEYNGFACGEAIQPRRPIPKERRGHLYLLMNALPLELRGYLLKAKMGQAERSI